MIERATVRDAGGPPTSDTSVTNTIEYDQPSLRLSPRRSNITLECRRLFGRAPPPPRSVLKRFIVPIAGHGGIRDPSTTGRTRRGEAGGRERPTWRDQ